MTATDDTIRKLATDAGASLDRADRQRNEVIRILNLGSGHLLVTFADGTTHRTASRDDMRGVDLGDMMVGEDLVRRFFPGLAKFKGTLPIGVPFYPRRIVLADGSVGTEWREAGR